jgi:L-ascorbate metabolism protein UlaG (beta-lactamase superfamily)
MMRLLLMSLLAVVFAAAQPARVTDEFPTAGGAVKITVIHHASLMIEGANQVIHVDPFSEGDYVGLPTAGLILITHDHFDHMDPKALALVRGASTVVIGPEAVAASLAGVTVLRNGESRQFGAWKIEAVPAYNLQRGPAPGKLFHPKGRGNGYVLTFADKRVYVAGDTENIPEMDGLKDIAVAFLPMNLPYTMTPEMAALAARAVNPRILYPYHFGSCDPQRLAELLKSWPSVSVRIRKMN